MKVSLNWVKEFTDVQLSVPELALKIGSQLGQVEEVIDLGKKYQGIIVAKVVSCVKHPDADKLSLCMIDDGGKAQNVERDSGGHIQVVCGAPNVREGLLVAWLPPGSTVPSSIDKDPFVLEARELRGKVSNGMLASAHELAISDDHNGIVELDDKDAKPGDDFAVAYQLNDYIIDIENKMFTHRPDCFGQLGIAREIAGIQQMSFVSPDWYIKGNSLQSEHDDNVKELSVDVQIPELCPRYVAIVISGVKIAPSPFWLQAKLAAVGLRPINNIVDMTNYMMMLTSQPLHAFDFDKVAVGGKAKIVVRKPREGEELGLLDGKTIKPRADAILICDADKPIGLGGVMGGGNSEIDENTTRIIIECANFDMYNIRRTSMEHGIFSEAVTRFTKGQSEWQCPPVLYKAAQMVEELCVGAKVIGSPVDVHTTHQQNKPLSVSATFIKERLGITLSPTEMAALLTNVEFSVEVKDDIMNVIAPSWRTDIEISEDIVEEVGRLYGYDHLPMELPRRSIQPVAQSVLIKLKSELRSTLSQAGASEILTYSFVHANLLERSGQDKEQAYKLSNALSPELQYYRMSLTPSLLDKVSVNIRSDMVRSDDNEFALFEIGKAHIKGEMDVYEPAVPKEVNSLALVFAADLKTAEHKYSGAPYFQAKKYLDHLLLSHKSQHKVRLEPLDKADLYNNPWLLQMTAAYEPSRSAVLRDIGSGETKGLIWGVVGEFKPGVRRNLKLPSYSSGFELDPLLFLIPSEQSGYVPLPKFPKVSQDISLKVAADLTYQELYQFVWETISSIQPEATLPTLQPIDIYLPKEDSSRKHVTFRLWLSAYNRTLKAEEVNTLLDQVAQKAKDKFGAERL